MKFLLIHGAWHTGEGWKYVQKHLSEQGHQSWAPTLKGNGDGVAKNYNHKQTVDGVIEFIEQNDLNDFVLLGHSYGGCIIQKVLERVPKKVRRIVFWNAFVLLDGQCLLDENPPHYVELVEGQAEQSNDDTCKIPWFIAREAFFNDCSFEDAKKYYDNYWSSQPLQPFRDKLDLKKFYSLQTPKSYINCREDIALPPGPETGWCPRMSNRLGLYRLVQMDGGHESLFTNPKILAQKIIEAGRD